MEKMHIQKLRQNGRGVDVYFKKSTIPDLFVIRSVNPNVVSCYFRGDEEYFMKRNFHSDGFDSSRELLPGDYQDFIKNSNY